MLDNVGRNILTLTKLYSNQTVIHRHKWKGNEKRIYGSYFIQKCPCGEIRKMPPTWVTERRKPMRQMPEKVINIQTLK